MGYVTDSIQFRTGGTTPNPHYAMTLNKIKTIILATGMQQVSLEEWPDQIGEVVTGDATGNDVSLDDIVVSSGINHIGKWVFKHPSMNLYVCVWVEILANRGTSSRFIVPRIRFEFGQEVATGESRFEGSAVVVTGLRNWVDTTTTSSDNAAYSLSRFPTSSYIVRAYCGTSGFWMASEAGAVLNLSSAGMSNTIVDHLPLVFGAALDSGDGVFRVALNTPSQSVSNASSTAGTELASVGGTDIRGVSPHTLIANTWRDETPGALGTLDAPHVHTTDRGFRIAQAQLYGSGSPIPLPLAMVPAVMQEVPFRMDLDGSGERTWIPLPALQAVQFVIDAAPPANLQNHCIYALPASDD